MYVNKPVQWILWAPWNLEFGQLPVAPKRKLIDSNHQFSEKTAIVSGSHWLFKMFIHSLFFLDWSNVQWFSVTSHHNITTARKPCDINRFGAASSPPVKYKTPRPSYWFFSIRMSNYIHAITCIIIYMGILLMQIQNTQPLNHSSPKSTFTPQPLKKNIPRMFSQIITKKSPNQFLSGLPEAGRISLKFWVKRQLKATISTWLGWKVDDWNSEIIPSLKLTVRTWKWAETQKETIVFQSSVFRGYVSFREGNPTPRLHYQLAPECFDD